MSRLFARLTAWLALLGGVATGAYAVYALASGSVVVESRLAGKSVYDAALQPGPFYGFVAFYFVCGAVFAALGALSLKKDK
jgi:hypothetical protein